MLTFASSSDSKGDAERVICTSNEGDYSNSKWEREFWSPDDK